MSTLERRSEMVKLTSLGLSLSETVNQLKQKYGVSKQAIYVDWTRRGKWLSAIMSMDNPEHFTLELMSKRREIYRLAAKEYLSGDSSASRVGALRLFNDIIRDEWEMASPILKNKAFNAVAKAGEAGPDLLARFDAVFGPQEKVEALTSMSQAKQLVGVKNEVAEDSWDLNNCTPEERETGLEANRIILREMEKSKLERGK